MEDDKTQLNNEMSSSNTLPAEIKSEETTALTVNTSDLNKESLELINKIIEETDIEKTKDLTYLFNVNQNKKTMVRVNKLSDLLDAITNQAYARFTERPDEISNKDLLDSLKTVQDLIERGQKQVSTPEETPLIQINQQNNEVNVGNSKSGNLSRDSREKVKNAVLSILNGINTTSATTPVNTAIEEDEPEDDIIEAETIETLKENEDDD